MTMDFIYCCFFIPRQKTQRLPQQLRSSFLAKAKHGLKVRVLPSSQRTVKPRCMTMRHIYACIFSQHYIVFLTSYPFCIVFRRFRQIWNNGSILSSSHFLLLPQCPLILCSLVKWSKLTLKIIILLP
jgi:hypothetical protein